MNDFEKLEAKIDKLETKLDTILTAISVYCTGGVYGYTKRDLVVRPRIEKEDEYIPRIEGKDEFI